MDHLTAGFAQRGIPRVAIPGVVSDHDIGRHVEIRSFVDLFLGIGSVNRNAVSLVVAQAAKLLAQLFLKLGGFRAPGDDALRFAAL